ncbi:MAG: DNA alkylation repair protein [Muribaculaceae bacterium]|nr:DNA alkylation repair protein [Muribaculaceae bacterium]
MGTNKAQEDIRDIRKEFFAFRNGIVADKLRKAGDPHSMIMGCLLVDIVSIMRQASLTMGDNIIRAQVAQELWNDSNSRECRLAAPMLYPPEEMGLEMALQWSESVESVEVADNLCHKLLRHINGSDTLFRQLISQEKPLVKYTGYRLLLNLMITGKMQLNDTLRVIIESEASQAEQPLLSLLKDILEEEN